MDENFSAQLSQEILKATGIKMQKKIQTEIDQTEKKYYLPQVEGKADVDASLYNINIKANPSAYLLRI